MSNTSKTITTVVIIVILAAIISWFWMKHQSGSMNMTPAQMNAMQQDNSMQPNQASTTSAGSQPAVTASNSTDASIDQDMNNIDGQMNNLDSDNANADQSLNASNK